MPIVHTQTFIDHVRETLIKHDVSIEEANMAIDHFMVNERAGYKSHGFRKIYFLLNDLEHRQHGAVKITQNGTVHAHLDGNKNMGLFAASQAMNMAKEKAKEHGIAFIGGGNCRGNVGALSYYTRQLAQDGLVSLMMVSSGLLGVVPYGGAEKRVGTNPISFGLPTKTDPVVGDYSTSVRAWGVVQMAMDAKQPLPEGTIVDCDGNPSTNPLDARTGGILPMAGYKGFGLGLMVQVMAGLCVDAVPETIGEWQDGFLMIAFKPDLFVSKEKYYDNMEAYIQTVKNTRTQQGFDEITLPGERSNKSLRENPVGETLELSQATLDAVNYHA